MRRYIALTAALLMLTACGGKNEQPAQGQANAEVSPEITSAEVTTDEFPEDVKPDLSDLRTYCVSLDAARNALLTDYKDKIPEKLKNTFDQNSKVLDDYMDKAGTKLTDDEVRKMFSEMEGLETFFCETMAEEVGAGDSISEIAKAATNGADYYFEKVSAENNTEETTEDTSEETSGETTTADAETTTKASEETTKKAK